MIVLSILYIVITFLIGVHFAPARLNFAVPDLSKYDTVFAVGIKINLNHAA